MDDVPEVLIGSARTFSGSLTDPQTGDPYTPAALEYRIDDVISGTQVLDWTQIAAAATFSVTIPATANVLLSEQSTKERRQIALRITDGAGNPDNKRFFYDVVYALGLASS